MKGFTTGCRYSKSGFMCKSCTAFYGDNLEPAHGSKATWSHEGVLFKENPGKKLWLQQFDDHKDAIWVKTNMKAEESISVVRAIDRSNENEL